MINWEDIKPQLKMVFYKSPHPLFIWNEGSPQQFVLTSATLYWAIKECLDKNDYALSSAQWTQRNIPRFIIEYLSKNKQIQINEKISHKTKAMTIDYDLKNIDVMNVMNEIFHGEYNEIHCKGEP